MRSRHRDERGAVAILTAVCLVLVVTSAAFAVDLWWRQGEAWHEATVPWGQFVLSAVAFGILGMSGWIGGKLAYTYGVRVAHEVHQAQAFTH